MTARLQALCARISPSDSFIDVGCDHGYVVQYAAEHRLAKRIAACDISKSSLDKAKNLIGEDAGVEFICADGASAAAGFDTVLIAGMGGHEILSIMAGCSPDTFIISPQSQASDVREKLLERDYSIIYDSVVEDGGKYYDIIQATKGGGRQQLTAAKSVQLQFGMFLHEKNEALYRKLIQRQKALAGYPPTEENLRKSAEVKEAILWQLR